MSDKTQPLSGHKATDMDSQVRVEISDTGQGIPKDQLHKVFDKFEQVSAKKSGTLQSTGLGLTFCKIAVEAHNGEIGIESELEKSTIFWFTLQSAEIEKSKQPQINTSFQVQASEFSLNEDDKKILEPFVLNLQQYEIYEMSKLRKLLKQTVSENTFSGNKAGYSIVSRNWKN